jgi:uncharacterized protein (TIGR02145 family)
MKTRNTLLILIITGILINVKVNSQGTSYDEQKNLIKPESASFQSSIKQWNEQKNLIGDFSKKSEEYSYTFFQKQDSSDNIDLTRGLIAYFPFNGNTYDESGYNHEAMIFRPMLTDDRFGNDSGAYKFEGETGDGPSCFSTAINPLWNDQLSISFWFKPKENQNTFSDLQGIISFNYEGILKIYYDHGNLVIELKDQNSHNYIYKKPIEFDSDTWYYMYLSCQSASHILLKINDTTSDLGAAPNSLLKSVSLLSSVMNYNISSSNTNSLFKGKMDDIRIYNRVLTESEIHALYKEGFESNPFPVLSIKPVGNISKQSAVSECLITSDGGSPVTIRGFCWDTLPDPDTNNHSIRCGVGTGNFSYTLTNLIPNTTYYIKAFAVNDRGIAFSYQRVFCTLPDKVYEEVTDIEGNIYKTIRIGDQNWLAENLRTSTLNDSSPIRLIANSGDWRSELDTTPAYCWFNYDEKTFKFPYGGLYNWHTVNTYKLCPTGWHIPNDADWDELANSLGGADVAGGKLKESGISHWLLPNTGATNESGFSGLPVSLAEPGSAFFPLGSYGAWWSATDGSIRLGSVRSTSRDSSNLEKWFSSKYKELSVRCVQYQSSVPHLTTNYITNVKDTSAVCGGERCADFDSTITSCGVCWSINPSPTINDHKTSDNTGTFQFTSYINGLTPNTTYYVRAYAVNQAGVGYGNEHSFKTMTGFTQDIEGNIYRTVTIGSQIWMADNLKTTRYNDNSPIPYIPDYNEWSILTGGAYCWYDTAFAYKREFGAVYNWFAVNTNKLCPSGWHVPDEMDWDSLSDYLGGESIAGGKMMEPGLSHWQNFHDGTNESGFTAIPAGYPGGETGNTDLGALWWSSTSSDGVDAWNRYVINWSVNLWRDSHNKKHGHSIRCLKDLGEQIELQNGLVAYYPFNGNTNDESGNGYSGTVNGASLTADRFGKSNSAYSFNGQGNSITVSGIKVPSSATTIALWVKERNGNGVEDFISKHCDGDNVEILMRAYNYGYRIEWTIGGTYFTLSDDNGIFPINPNEPKFDFLVLTYDGQKARFYINNIEVASRNIIGQIVNNDLPMTIGRYACSNGEDLNGIVDDIRIYNRALNNDEILALYNETNISNTGLTNIALNKPVTQSSTQYESVPERAVDGNTSGIWDNGSVTHTYNDENAWWEVDLGGIYNISTIELWNRTDYCCMARLSDFYVFASDQPFESKQLDATLNQSNVWHVFTSDFPDPADTFLVGRTARYIRIQSAHSAELNIAEVIVMGSLIKPQPVLTNIALNKPVTQSSTQYGGVPERAVDGNTSGDWDNGSVTHTYYNENAWWEVDLGGIYNINTIELWNRTNSCCKDRLSDFHVFASDQPFESKQLDVTLNQSNVWHVFKSDYPDPADTLMVGRTARYIRIQSALSAELNIAEVIVMGSLNPTQPGLTNIAHNKPVTQSSTQYGGVPERAVDGNTSGDWDNGSVTHTYYNENAWWEVDLGGIYNINTIELWNRTNSCCMDRLSDFYVFASDDAFVSKQLDVTLNQSNVWDVFKSDYPNPADIFMVNRTARYIRIQNAHSAELNIAEVIVMGSPTELTFKSTENKSITTEIALPGIYIYPMPFNDIIHFECDQIISTIEFFNVLGQDLIRQECGKSSAEINTDLLLPGLYFVRINTKDGKLNTYTVIKSDR